MPLSIAKSRFRFAKEGFAKSLARQRSASGEPWSVSAVQLGRKELNLIHGYLFGEKVRGRRSSLRRRVEPGSEVDRGLVHRFGRASGKTNVARSGFSIMARNSLLPLLPIGILNCW